MTTDRLFQSKSPLPSSRRDDGAYPLVIIVDDDSSVRESLSDLVSSAGLESMDFASTRELLEADLPDRPGCLILDVRMPGLSGLDLQHHLAQTGNPKPVIFLTGHGDIPMTVQAMKAGAIDFLTKPVRDQTLLDAVSAGIAIDVARRRDAAALRGSIERFGTLTKRERDVLQSVANGRLNKQIAFDLGISEVTVKMHRSNAMRKMAVRSLGDFLRIWETLPDSMRMRQ